ncbi:uncharacterized, partial [Tachysurus ichikawai]
MHSKCPKLPPGPVLVASGLQCTSVCTRDSSPELQRFS